MAIKTRIQSKNGTEAEWNLATNFIPLKGEVIIYNTDEESIFPRIKIGDGETPVTQLPFANGEISDSEIDEICGIITISNVLAENSWDVIQKAARDGTAKNYWNVGDRIGVELNGTCSKLTFSNETYYAYILGFDHNPEYEETGIHFQFGFTAASGGVNIAFISGFNDDSDFYMNPSATNAGGWASSFMRSTVCANFFNCLPTALQNIIASTTKWTDNTGGNVNNSVGDTASYVTSTSDKIFLLAEYEIYGAKTHANRTEQNYQVQYDYYKNGNSKVKYRHTATDSTFTWWTRSPDSGGFDHFCSVSDDGNISGDLADASYGFAPAFRVG